MSDCFYESGHVCSSTGLFGGLPDTPQKHLHELHTSADADVLTASQMSRNPHCRMHGEEFYGDFVCAGQGLCVSCAVADGYVSE